MKLDLAHQILSYPNQAESKWATTPHLRERADFRIDNTRKTIAENPVFNLDNLAEFYSLQMSDSTGPIDFIQSLGLPIAPPFQKCFFQFSATSELMGFGLFGAEMYCMDVTEQTMHIAKATTGEYSRRVDIGWKILRLEPFYQRFPYAPQLSPCSTVVAINDEHKVEFLMNTSDVESGFDRWEYRHQQIGTRVLFAIALMHCKNVTAKADDGPKISEKIRRRKRYPAIEYKVLKVRVPGSVRRATTGELGEESEPQSKRRLHLVRGYVATYTEEKPLFGKYTGQFYIPPHLRGDEKQGKVIKDYEVCHAT